ncbi:acetylxylan esterase [Niabella sp.]|uniref:acetylxylan esterase n=1 Tax=Niabella sp. TaxID=1962976 RepID=UPI0026116974|nr:acetylxylan esterase [Niabella sp.]
MKIEMVRKLFLAIFLWGCSVGFAQGQSRSSTMIQVLVTPNKPDWNYRLGEEAAFEITVLKHQVPMEQVKISYGVGPEKMPPVEKGEKVVQNGKSIIVKGKMTVPGFLRCDAAVLIDGIQYRGMATAAYQPEAIQPTQVLPKDFSAFWDKAKAEVSGVPLDPVMTLLPERSTEKTNVYELSIQNDAAGSRVYGILCVPKAQGKYPALLQVPGAGVRPYQGQIALAEKGIITLEIGIHGIPVTLPATVYTNLAQGALREYNAVNMDDRNKYYYKRVYLGCIRAVDYLTSLPQYDGTNLAVSGGSQGGALSIITTALDKRVKYFVALYPALCDITGYLHKRAGGWPHLFMQQNGSAAEKARIETSAYYDVVNFARLIKVPGFYSWGYNDETCPPTSFYSAYNVISAPKELMLVQETGHWTFPEQSTRVSGWLESKLKQ